MSQKRIRSINWYEEEKQLFRKVYREHAQIIENKSLDSTTIRAKNKAWEQVHTKFNQLNDQPRALNQLKHQWKAMKVNEKKKETNKTGCGTIPPTPNDTSMEIKDLLNSGERWVDDNLYDSNGVVVGNMEMKTTSDTSNAQDHEGYVNSMISHSQILKDKEHLRRMEMAEEEHAIKMEIYKEEHAIKMEIHRENLKSAILQREILELKERDLILNKQ